MIQKTNPIRRWKQWLALPLAGVLVVAVACEKAAPPATPAAKTEQPVKMHGQPPPPSSFTTAPAQRCCRPRQPVRLYTIWLSKCRNCRAAVGRQPL